MYSGNEGYPLTYIDLVFHGGTILTAYSSIRVWSCAGSVLYQEIGLKPFFMIGITKRSQAFQYKCIGGIQDKCSKLSQGVQSVLLASYLGSKVVDCRSRRRRLLA